MIWASNPRLRMADVSSMTVGLHIACAAATKLQGTTTTQEREITGHLLIVYGINHKARLTNLTVRREVPRSGRAQTEKFGFFFLATCTTYGQTNCKNVIFRKYKEEKPHCRATFGDKTNLNNRKSIYLF